jgi:hypothetical protein
MTELTLEMLKEWLWLNPDDGHFYWIKSKQHKQKVGAKAGHTDKSGQHTIRLFNKRYKLPRLRYFYEHGRFPRGPLPSHNRKLPPVWGVVPFRGVTERKYPNGGTVYVAHYQRGEKKNLFLGSYPTPEQASAAFEEYVITKGDGRR